MDPTEGAPNIMACIMAKRKSTGNRGTKLLQGTQQNDLVSGGGSGKKSKTATPAVRSSLLTNQITCSCHGHNADDGGDPLFQPLGPEDCTQE
jgi:hypothetical protein